MNLQNKLLSLKKSKWLRRIDYAALIWHGIAIVVYPLKIKIYEPFNYVIREYSYRLSLYPSWGFFTYMPQENVRILYVTDREPQAEKLFYGIDGTYAERIRSYRCAGCSNAAYQLRLRKDDPPKGWQAAFMICRLEPEADSVQIKVLSAPVTSDQYSTHKEIEIKCHQYRE